MTSMEQIEYIAAEARKMGLKYGEYVEKYGHTLPKPQKNINVVFPEPIKLVCKMCGNSFTAGRKDAKYCPDCRKERYNDYYRERERNKREKAQEQEPPTEEKIVYCAVCGVEMIVQNRNQKYCDACKRDKWNKYQNEYKAKKQRRDNAEK